jgi:hypothetical protein
MSHAPVAIGKQPTQVPLYVLLIAFLKVGVLLARILTVLFVLGFSNVTLQQYSRYKVCLH